MELFRSGGAGWSCSAAVVQDGAVPQRWCRMELFRSGGAGWSCSAAVAQDGAVPQRWCRMELFCGNFAGGKISPGENFATFRSGEICGRISPAKFSHGEPPPPPPVTPQSSAPPQWRGSKCALPSQSPRSPASSRSRVRSGMKPHRLEDEGSVDKSIRGEGGGGSGLRERGLPALLLVSGSLYALWASCVCSSDSMAEVAARSLGLRNARTVGSVRSFGSLDWRGGRSTAWGASSQGTDHAGGWGRRGSGV